VLETIPLALSRTRHTLTGLFAYPWRTHEQFASVDLWRKCLTRVSDAAYRIAFALDTKLTPKGRPQSLMRKHEPELRRLIDEGVSNPEIAKPFNVSTATVFNWRRKLGI
jgi:DNA-binding NarL/FixJ family response regulator